MNPNWDKKKEHVLHLGEDGLRHPVPLPVAFTVPDPPSAHKHQTRCPHWLFGLSPHARSGESVSAQALCNRRRQSGRKRHSEDFELFELHKFNEKTRSGERRVRSYRRLLLSFSLNKTQRRSSSVGLPALSGRSHSQTKLQSFKAFRGIFTRRSLFRAVRAKRKEEI